MRFFVAISIAATALFSTGLADSHAKCACQIASDRGTNDAATAGMCSYVGGVMSKSNVGFEKQVTTWSLTSILADNTITTGVLYPGKYCQGIGGHELGGDAVYEACRSQKCGDTYCQDSTCV
ncbi:hypothetical protein GTA08_BOTSDO01509 [Neofusicoccum parvum]|uniref:Uncharacterized protein n=1 Tax=Neofusicoccum parvum TaxID=310453 RepID=A0ACB5S1J7_9PEZI|nr:hypothetical protein GTA08_BOTSDO01509 [Neofusicoccum parvum]